MADNRCPNCGKGLAHVAFIDSDRAIELPCSCEPAPDALTLILLEMRAIRALLEGRSGQHIPVEMLATIHEGNAVVPTAWADLTSRSGKTPESSPGRTASGPGAA